MNYVIDWEIVVGIANIVMALGVVLVFVQIVQAGRQQKTQKEIEICMHVLCL